MSILREKTIQGADGRSLCRTIRARGKIDPVFVPDAKSLPSVLANIMQDNDLILTQGAGDIGKVARQLEQLKLNVANMQNG